MGQSGLAAAVVGRSWHVVETTTGATLLILHASCLKVGVVVARDYDGGNTTGFVSPAGDSLEGPIDLSEILDLRRPHRYPVRVKGDALAERGIQHGDILIADAAATPAAGRVVIAMIHGDVLVCQLAFRHGQWWLRPSGAGKEPLPVRDEAEIWAVVAALVRTKI